MKIRSQLVLLFVVQAVTSLLVTVFSTVISVNVIRQEAFAYAEGLVELTGQYIGEYGSEVVDIADAVRKNPTVQQFLMTDQDHPSMVNLAIEMQETMLPMLKIKKGVAGIALYQGNKKFSLYGAFRLYFEDPLPDVDTPTFTRLYRDSSNTYTYCVVPVYDTEIKWSLKKIGHVVIAVQPRHINTIFRRFSPSERAIFYMTDGEGNVLASGGDNDEVVAGVIAGNYADKDMIRMGEERYQYLERNIDAMGMRIVYLLPISDMTRSSQRVLTINTTILAVTILVFFLIAWQTYRNIAQPIGAIAAFSQGRRGPPGKKMLELEVRNELQTIVDAINSMLEENEQKTEQLLEAQSDLYEAELSKNKARLSYLQTQINPHFLYNTLECIRSIADVREVPEISMIALSMARCFRYSISGDETATLGEELDCIRDYFQVISVRYEGRFTLHIECPEALKGYRVLKMLLQPLVENAVKHGLERKRSKGWVKVLCSRQEDMLVLEVSNNGMGMTAEALAELQENLATLAEDRSVGLPNTLRRLKSYYGHYVFHIDSQQDEGTHIRLELPVGRKERRV